MFSGRLPDHLLQAGTMLDEVAEFGALVENQELLKKIVAWRRPSTPLKMRKKKYITGIVAQNPWINGLFAQNLQ